MNNQSLDRVREAIRTTLLRLTVRNANEVKIAGYLNQEHLDEAVSDIETLINSELQNLRQELVREVEGLEENYLTAPESSASEIRAYNKALTRVLAIIKGEK